MDQNHKLFLRKTIIGFGVISTIGTVTAIAQDVESAAKGVLKNLRMTQRQQPQSALAPEPAAAAQQIAPAPKPTEAAQQTATSAPLSAQQEAAEPEEPADAPASATADPDADEGMDEGSPDA